jgi:hypothetical protein
MITIKDVLLNMGPCEPGAGWLATQPDLTTAWQNCQRSDWMMWLCNQLDILTNQQDLAIQLAVLDTPLADGRRVIDLITDPRSLAFIEMKRQRLAGVEIDINTWSAAGSAAGSAARSAASDAAWSAAAAAWQADRIREIVGNPFIEGAL